MMTRLTHGRVVEIAGALTDEQIARILACDADEGELLAAMTWLSADDYMGRETLEEPSGKVAALCEILESGEPAPEDARDDRR